MAIKNTYSALKISIVNLVENLPKIIENNNWQRKVLKWINVLEEEIS